MSGEVLQFPTVDNSEALAGLPNRIRFWRLKRGYTLKQLASKSGITFAHISKTELGQRELTKLIMERLSQALDVCEADLLAEADGGLTEAERELIRTYREIPAPMRAAIDAVAESQQPFRGLGEVVGLTHRKAG